MNKNDIAAAIEPQINQGLTIIALSFLMGVGFMYGYRLFHAPQCRNPSGRCL